MREMNKTTYRLNIVAALLFGLSIGLLLGIPIPSHRGYITPLGNKMGVALVRQQDPTIITIAMDKMVSYASSVSIPSNVDQYATILNSYGAALEIIKKKTTPGIMVMGISEDFPAKSYNVKVGDIVKLSENEIKKISSNPQNRQIYLEKIFQNTTLIHKDGTTQAIRLPKKYFKNLIIQDISSIALPKKFTINENVLHAQGNSDGLSMTIYLVDSMTKGSLLPKIKIAATGAVVSGTHSLNEPHPVLAIGSLGIKYQAIKREKYDIFFIPKANEDEIKIKGSTKVISVDNVETAINKLCQLSKNQDEICKLENIKHLKESKAIVTYYSPSSTGY